MLLFLGKDSVGYAYQRVAWANPVTGAHGGTDLVIKVPCYKVIIENIDEKTGKVKSSNSNYAVVRDAWVIETKDDNPPNIENQKTITLKNWGYEPAYENMTFDLTLQKDYPQGSNLPAYSISYKGMNTYPANSKALKPVQGNMLLHVGGVYNKGIRGARPVYSVGCFGLVDPNQIKIGYQKIIDSKENLSNNTIIDFASEINRVQTKSSDKKITLLIQGRSAFQKTGYIYKKHYFFTR